MLKFETVLVTAEYYEEENILFMRMKSDIDLTIELARKSFEQTHAVIGERDVKVILDSRPIEFTHIPKEVMEYMGNSPYNKYQQSAAIVINSLGQKLISNFYITVIKPVVRTKVFNSLEAALEWQGVKNKNLLK